MKKITLLALALMATFTINAQEVILSQTSGDITPNGVSCAGADNYWLRAYDLANHGITESMSVVGVEFGVQNMGFAADLEVYAWEYVGFPGGFDIYSLPTPIGFGEIEVTVDEIGMTVKAYFEEGTTVAADANIVVAVHQEADGNNLFLMTLSNETASSYIASDACGLAEPETVATVGFPDAHHIINLILDSTVSVGDVLSENVSVYPNPTFDVFNISLPSNVVVNSSSLVDVLGKTTGVVYNNGKMDVSSLAPGVYFLKLETNLGTYTQKVVKQ